MKVNICGIPHKVIYCKDEFNTDTHYGQIDYGKAVIKISEGVSREQQDEALCHEILHGILVHIGKDELSQDESFVQCLSNALYQSFEPKFMRGGRGMRLIDADAFKEWLMKNSISEREEEESRQIGIWIDSFPSAEPEIKPISYQDCSNAMLKMWIDNVLTDGEYNKIMDKLNAKYRGDSDG